MIKWFRTNKRLKELLKQKTEEPDITEEESHLAIQHYMNGHMRDAIKKLKL